MIERRVTISNVSPIIDIMIELRAKGQIPRVFLCQPMSGKSDAEILEEREKAKKILEQDFLGPIDIIPTFFENLDMAGVKKSGVLYLGKSLEVLAQADFAVFLNDWYEYRGCKIEEKVCSEYGIPGVSLDLRMCEI